jgi:lipoprotein-releasing system permease protein
VILPPEIYKLDHVSIQLRAIDIISIALATVGICWLATLIPSKRAARLDPIQGLKYE